MFIEKPQSPLIYFPYQCETNNFFKSAFFFCRCIIWPLKLWWLWSLLERLPRRRWCWLILWLDPAWDPAKLLSCLRVSSMIFSNLEHKNSSRMTMLKMEVSLLLTHLSLVNQIIPDTTLSQGHPMTVFCEISVRRSNNCLEFSIA